MMRLLWKAQDTRSVLGPPPTTISWVTNYQKWTRPASTSSGIRIESSIYGQNGNIPSKSRKTANDDNDSSGPNVIPVRIKVVPLQGGNGIIGSSQLLLEGGSIAGK